MEIVLIGMWILRRHSVAGGGEGHRLEINLFRVFAFSTSCGGGHWWVGPGAILQIFSLKVLGYLNDLRANGHSKKMSERAKSCDPLIHFNNQIDVLSWFS